MISLQKEENMLIDLYYHISRLVNDFSDEKECLSIDDCGDFLHLCFKSNDIDFKIKIGINSIFITNINDSELTPTHGDYLYELYKFNEKLFKSKFSLRRGGEDSFTIRFDSSRSITFFVKDYFSLIINDKVTSDFMTELESLYRKYDRSISHEDCHGGFKIEKFSEDNLKWIKEAEFKDW